MNLISYALTFVDHSLLSGETRQVENDQFQEGPLPVFIYYTPLPVDGFHLDRDEKSRTYLFVTSIDENKSRAKRTFDYGECSISIFWLKDQSSSLAASQQQPNAILSSHVSRWNAVWSSGRVDIEGDDELQRQINSAFYYILSSLPPLATRSEPKQFYGLSPGSLSRGGLLGEDYGGHSFWDTETWMFPPVLLFYPT